MLKRNIFCSSNHSLCSDYRLPGLQLAMRGEAFRERHKPHIAKEKLQNRIDAQDRA